MLTERYVCGRLEAAARGLGAGCADLAVIEAHPLPVHLGAVVHAYVNHGRWLADCPACNGAEAVTRAYPFFYCDSCGQEWAQGALARVVFPSDADAAERLLGQRRDARVQNWRPGEQPDGVTIAAWLHAENIVRGVTTATASERVRAKAVYFGHGNVAAELEHLELLGDEAFDAAVAAATKDA